MKKKLHLDFGGYSDAGAKPLNQDAFTALIPSEHSARKFKGAAACIADGVSCSSYAQHASQTAATNFISDYFSTPDFWTVKQSVQSAGRRLLLGRKITDPNLIELTLTKLDMLDEKHRYLTKSRKSVRSATSNKGGIMGVARATRSQQNSQQRSTKAWDKATELLKKEQKEDAVRLLSNAFIKSSKSNNPDYETRKIKEVAKKHKLEGDILAFINPKDAVSPRKWVNYFHVADAFEMKAEKDKALKHLKSLTIVPQSLRLPIT